MLCNIKALFNLELNKASCDFFHCLLFVDKFKYLPPELRSRFSYKCALWPLSEREKEEYVTFKSECYLDQIKRECPTIDGTLKASDIINIDVARYSNMRDINSEIMRQITDSLYAQIVK